ncbi:MAG: carbohydrate kinase family protein [Patescibacteria group bacterium]
MQSKTKTNKNGLDVITIGAATRDVFVRSKKFENIPSDTAPDGFNACLPLGAKIPIDELVFETGGGATNAAVTFARFGLKTGCISRVGYDIGGREILEKLKTEKIDTSSIQKDKIHRTAYSIILLSGTGHRAILVYRGASSNLDVKATDWKRVKSNWIYLTSVAGKMDFIKKIFEHAKSNLTQIAWNPGNKEIELGLKKLLPFIMQTDLLFLNLEEAAALTNTTPRHEDLIVKTLSPLPRTALIITDGSHGAHVYSRGYTWRASALKGKAINTTGAGDAFGSAFTAAIIKDGDLKKALKVGSLNAFGVVTHMGAKAGILKAYPGTNQITKVKIIERI